MNFNRSQTAGVLLALALAAPAIALAGTYDIPWSTIDGGGGMSSTGGTYSLSGTIGQPDAQTLPVMAGGSFQITGGFWPGAAPVCTLPGDMNLDTRVNGLDVQYFVNCAMGVNGSNCACADFDANGVVDMADVPMFLSVVLN